MIARVVDPREGGAFAVGVSGLAAAFVGLAAFDDLVHIGIPMQSGLQVYVMVAVTFVIAALAPWLVRRSRGFTTRIAGASGVIVAGSLVISAKDVTGVHVAAGARGHSIAIARGRRLAFIEVEREEDVARLLGELGTPTGDVRLPSSRRDLVFLQAVFSFALLVCAPLYFAGALRIIDAAAKTMFGWPSVVLCVISFALVAARRSLSTSGLAVRHGAWHAHVALHARSGEAPPIETRDAALSRGHESLEAWIERLDSFPAELGAYRGDAMKKDVLWEKLNDGAAPVDERMAAARVLRRRYGEEDAALVRVVREPDVRARVEAALEEPEDASRRLEELGPLFRAR